MPFKLAKISATLGRRLILGGLLVLGITLLAYSNIERGKNYSQAQERALFLTEAVFNQASTSPLMLYASSELFTSRRELDWSGYILFLRQQLGRLRTIESTTGSANENSARFSVFVEFDTGNAEIRIRLSRHQGDWLADEFTVIADALSG